LTLRAPLDEAWNRVLARLGWQAAVAC